MADDLEQQIQSCKKRVEIVRTLIEEQWQTAYRPTKLNECLNKNLTFLKTLNEKLATGESNGDC